MNGVVLIRGESWAACLCFSNISSSGQRVYRPLEARGTDLLLGIRGPGAGRHQDPVPSQVALCDGCVLMYPPRAPRGTVPPLTCSSLRTGEPTGVPRTFCVARNLEFSQANGTAVNSEKGNPFVRISINCQAGGFASLSLPARRPCCFASLHHSSYLPDFLLTR